MDSPKLSNITSPLAKRSRKSSRHVHFGEVKTFKFGRAQGLCTVPEGGLALGMEDCCFEIETKELSDVVENKSCYAQPRKFTLSERREMLNMAELLDVTAKRVSVTHLDAAVLKITFHVIGWLMKAFVVAQKNAAILMVGSRINILRRKLWN
ncbi:hypothetical protein T06_9700 [Trichinella sp. T6]|nr:hypothetical protein T06_9700 [Trichinella sp. T6]